MNYSRAEIQVMSRTVVSTPAQGSIGTTAGTALVANPAARFRSIQNTGSTVLKIVLGTGTPTQTVYHYALQAGSAADDGKGGVWFSDAWTGAVQILSDNAGGTYVATELT